MKPGPSRKAAVVLAVVGLAGIEAVVVALAEIVAADPAGKTRIYHPRVQYIL
jgi:hypothetical protein